MATPPVAHRDVDEFLTAMFPELTSSCGSQIDEASLAKTVCGLFRLALADPKANVGDGTLVFFKSPTVQMRRRLGQQTANRLAFPM